jgi:hypothetical protein
MSNYRHGKRRTAVYGVWSSMLSRCQNQNDKAFQNYGGRGIGVCARWQEFKNFLADMGEPPSGLSLDRVDNSLGYSPENCRWATRVDQSRNRRGVHRIRVGDAELTLPEWSARNGIAHKTILERLRKGWDPAAAVTFPTMKTRSGIKHGAHIYQAFGAQ